MDNIRDTLINNDNFFIHEASFLQKIAKNNIRNINVLDFGGGNMCQFQKYFSRFQCSTQFNVTTLDIQSKKHSLNNNYVYVKYDGLTIPYCDDYFDVVICNFVLHHIPVKNRNRIFSEISRVCKHKLIILEDILHDDVGTMISKLNFMCSRQSPNMTKHMHDKNQWINIMSHYKFKATNGINLLGNKQGISHVMIFYDKII